jgi:hypothetical protein
MLYRERMPHSDPETLRRVARVALSRAAENRSDPTFDGMARGGAQRVLQQLAKDLEAAALFAECEIRLDESPVELVQVAEQAWSSTDGLLELRRKLIRQGTLIDLYVDGRQIKQFYMDAEIGYGLEGPEFGARLRHHARAGANRGSWNDVRRDPAGLRTRSRGNVRQSTKYHRL